jgi:Na+/H+ antiporter NhaD/arsenite permease-like protein
MLLGLFLANLIGTLGASMLLIRPLLRSNRGRKHEKHIVIFFIFIVSNCAGMLTPLGDPPLLYGYLVGVPFLWPLKLFPIWFFINSLLIAIFAALDSYFFIRDPDFRGPLKHEAKEPFRILGRWNLVLAVACALVLLLPQWLSLPGEFWSVALRSAGLVVIIYLSDRLTPKQIITLNKFSWEPFKEVMAIFAAIFSTIILTSKYLESVAPNWAHTLKPWSIFWITGIFSSILDNAPTYASMLSVVSSLPESISCVNLNNGKCVEEIYLMAISASSVAFGAATYIGNAPNLLIKALANSEGHRAPTFFGYILWVLAFLLPALFLTGLLFFI